MQSSRDRNAARGSPARNSRLAARRMSGGSATTWVPKAAADSKATMSAFNAASIDRSWQMSA